VGLGFKSWAAGDVLTASDVNGYLMDQGVMSFASASARDTALTGELAEGMVAYLRDTDELVVYNGSVWRTFSDGQLQTYTPALTAPTTNPTLGSGSSVVGRYVRGGRMVTVWVRIGFGSSGVSAGSGQYTVSLPVAASTITASSSNGSGQAIGFGHIRDDGSTSNNTVISVNLTTATTVRFVVAPGGAVSESNPISWAANDVITFQACYPFA
jgi:hypothetical protein